MFMKVGKVVNLAGGEIMNGRGKGKASAVRVGLFLDVGAEYACCIQICGNSFSYTFMICALFSITLTSN